MENCNQFNIMKFNCLNFPRQQVPAEKCPSVAECSKISISDFSEKNNNNFSLLQSTKMVKNKLPPNNHRTKDARLIILDKEIAGD